MFTSEVRCDFDGETVDHGGETEWHNDCHNTFVGEIDLRLPLIDFINILRAAFAHIGPKSTKHC